MLRLLVPFHNTTPWLARCLASIREQSVQDWTCHLADDGSNDGSVRIAQKLVAMDSRFTLIRNATRLYQCGNYRNLLSNPTFDPQDICVTIDGDDWLADSRVFERILKAYADNRTWLTWGSYVRTDGVPGICSPLEDTAEVRHVSYRTSQLRTWRLFLFRNIRPDDFLGPDGKLLRAAGDVACMFPMIEMAGNRHVKFLEEINYVYNRENPLSNYRTRLAEQHRNANFLRAKPPYAPLDDPAHVVKLDSAVAGSLTPPHQENGSPIPSLSPQGSREPSVVQSYCE